MLSKIAEAASPRLDLALELMTNFAFDTGLTGERPPRRYLWTDAHAVCNFLELGRRLGDPAQVTRAADLVTQVHEVLGKHRADDSRSGWISGLGDTQGSRHPTAGGLRIGKNQPERRPDATYDAHREWDQDGQYFHYLTKWMHALNAMANATGEARYRSWAVELAIAAYRRFRSSSGPHRLYWKMSIDLSYPLVPSSGLHDPLDGLVTCLALRARHDAAEAEELDAVIVDLGELCRGASWLTDDPLGIGGLLFDAGRIAQLPGPLAISQENLLQSILGAAQGGLAALARSNLLELPAARRLAFRELGLAIGLQSIDLMYRHRAADPVLLRLDPLSPYRHLRDVIEMFWCESSSRQNPVWREHGDINAVMLATCLVPNAFLEI